MTEFWHHFTEIVTDPAHAAAEIFFMLVIDGLLLGVVVPLLKRSLTRTLRRDIHFEHHVIDAEHGVSHPADAACADIPIHGLSETIPDSPAYTGGRR